MYNISPANWSEVRDIAEFFNGWDWDNDGEIEYGIVFIARQNSQAMWSALDLIAQYTTVAGKPSNYTSNMFFDADTIAGTIQAETWLQTVPGLRLITH